MITQLEGTLLMCDATLARLDPASTPATHLLDDVKRLRQETLAELARLRKRHGANAGRDGGAVTADAG